MAMVDDNDNDDDNDDDARYSGMVSSFRKPVYLIDLEGYNSVYDGGALRYFSVVPTELLLKKKTQ